MKMSLVGEPGTAEQKDGVIYGGEGQAQMGQALMLALASLPAGPTWRAIGPWRAAADP